MNRFVRHFLTNTFLYMINNARTTENIFGTMQQLYESTVYSMKA